MRRLSLIAAVLLAASAMAGCVVPEDMPALREELGYASVERPDLVLRLRASTQTPTVDETVNLTAEVEGLDSSLVDVSWTINGTEDQGSRIQVSFPTPGARTVRAEAVGPNGTTATDELEIDVRPNTPPTPQLVVEDRGSLVASEPVVMHASGSSDPDGDTLSYTWRLDGERIDAGPRLERSLASGSHDVQVTVSDGHAEAPAQTTFAVDRLVSHTVDLSVSNDSAEFTVPIHEGLDTLQVQLTHSTRSGIDDVSLTLQGPDGEAVASSSSAPEPGASEGEERIEVSGADLSTQPHTLVTRLERGSEATVTIEGVLTYVPLPAEPR